MKFRKLPIIVLTSKKINNYYCGKTARTKQNAFYPNKLNSKISMCALATTRKIARKFIAIYLIIIPLINKIQI